jgi:hypothetical protein
MASHRSAVLSAAIMSTVFAWPHCLQGGEVLTLRVTPTHAVAPAFIRVIASVESHEDNRALEVVAESGSMAPVRRASRSWTSPTFRRAIT